MDCNQILHTSIDHLKCYVGGLETRQTHRRWWMAAILKNGKIAISPKLLGYFDEMRVSTVKELVKVRDGKMTLSGDMFLLADVHVLIVFLCSY